jgi:2-C-methyl-D-erythritol 4-phosphate cytidylyltransferase
VTTRAPLCFALVPAAGSGSRAAQALPKQYVVIAGRPMLAHTLAALAAVPELSQVAVVLASDDERFEAALPGFSGWVWRCGGPSRAASVAAGLAQLRAQGAQDEDWVLVHDAARCLIRPEWVRELLRRCSNDEVGGLLALPMADTMKRGEQGRAVKTLNRERVWAAQTPQMFRLALLEQALQQAGDAVTDEASAVERLGLTPLLVRCAMENFKVTLPEDFVVAEALLKART